MIKAGYKQTEVGVIPEDWEVVKLGAIGQFKNGINKGNEAFGHGYPFVNLLDVFGKNSLSLRPEFGLVDSSDVERGMYDLKQSDVIFIRSSVKPSGVSLTAVVMEDLPQMVYSGFLIRYRDKGYIDTDFKKFCFYAESFRKSIIAASSVSANTNINQDNLKRLNIALPSTKAEQTAIAKALNDTDALIQSLSQLIAKKRQIKQGAMQSLLNPYDETGALKAGWEVKKLGDFLNYEQPTEYLVSDTEYNDNNQIPVLTAGKTFILGFTNEEHGIFRNLPVIIFDDFTTAIKFVDFPFKAKSSAMKMLIPKSDKVNLRFIYEIMLQIKYPLGDHKRHWIGEYQFLEITIPASLDEQAKIAKTLTDMDTEITTLETKLSKYQKIKQGMMQNLLTGRIRLVIPSLQAGKDKTS